MNLHFQIRINGFEEKEMIIRFEINNHENVSVIYLSELQIMVNSKKEKMQFCTRDFYRCLLKIELKVRRWKKISFELLSYNL